MRRVTLDTNVIVSGIAGDPTMPPGAIIQRWISGEFHVILSEAIRREVTRTLQRDYYRRRLTDEERAFFTNLIDERAEFVGVDAVRFAIATHPEDDLILATAEAGRVDALVTGDRQLLRLERHAGIPIVSPAQFLPILDRWRLED